MAQAPEQEAGHPETHIRWRQKQRFLRGSVGLEVAQAEPSPSDAGVNSLVGTVSTRRRH